MGVRRAIPDALLWSHGERALGRPEQSKTRHPPAPAASTISAHRFRKTSTSALLQAKRGIKTWLTRLTFLHFPTLTRSAHPQWRGTFKNSCQSRDQKRCKKQSAKVDVNCAPQSRGTPWLFAHINNTQHTISTGGCYHVTLQPDWRHNGRPFDLVRIYLVGVLFASIEFNSRAGFKISDYGGYQSFIKGFFYHDKKKEKNTRELWLIIKQENPDLWMWISCCCLRSNMRGLRPAAARRREAAGGGAHLHIILKFNWVFALGEEATEIAWGFPKEADERACSDTRRRQHHHPKIPPHIYIGWFRSEWLT